MRSRHTKINSPRIQEPLRVRILQISGISLLVLSVLNLLFLKRTGLFLNMTLAGFGVFQLWLSFRIWQRRLRFQKSVRL